MIMSNVATCLGRVVPAAAAQVSRESLNSLQRRSIHLISHSSSSSAAPRAKIIPAMSATVTPRAIHSSCAQMAQITVDVPTMGDSITEGTIVEWCVPPGSHVKEGDVIAMVETDKVTIDIKTDQEGVLIKQLGEVDDTVEVGHGLYVLDTDVSAAESFSADTVSEVNDSIDAVKAGEEKQEAPPSTSPVTPPGTRVPSIHFLGKEGWKVKLTASDPATAPLSGTSQINSDKPQSPTSVTHMPYRFMYGRPTITDEEIEALILGGAEEAPEVSNQTAGVVFYGGKVVTAGPRYFWTAD